MTDFTYTISTGTLLASCNTTFPPFQGYAGAPGHVNDPNSVKMIGKGPLPPGLYTIKPAITHPRLGPIALHLIPDPSNEMFGRSDFWIHGDNKSGNQSASHGCIVLTKHYRYLISEEVKKGHNSLEVIL